MIVKLTYANNDIDEIYKTYEISNISMIDRIDNGKTLELFELITDNNSIFYLNKIALYNEEQELLISNIHTIELCL